MTAGSPERPFYRLSGAGNDFLALVGPAPPPPADTIAAWCRRGVSLGADGLFRIERQPDGAVAMEYFNADGRPADLCLNGSRCAARLAAELGWTLPGSPAVVEIRTAVGSLRARRAGAEAVEIEVPAPAPPRGLRLELDDAAWEGDLVSAGVPHLVLWWAGTLADAPVASLGPALRRHPGLGPPGANVNFVRATAPDRLEIRTFERGVEGETLACGTGVLAAVRSGLGRGRLALPVAAITLGGFSLEVRAAPAGAGGERWLLAGDARLVASGTVAAGAAAAPRPAVWSD